MTQQPTVRVAAVQASPVILDAEATVTKAVGLLGEAAALGADLAVFSECFVSFYPQRQWGDADPYGSASTTARSRCLALWWTGCWRRAEPTGSMP